ncbi:MAG: hypothetical protein HY259_14590, partial [Chloroflexi bacterium]|nr:hypothetical protein [Chloroflexota bacterium]
FREVLGDDPKLIGMQELIVNRPRRPFSTYIFDELLVDIANGLRRQPEDLGLLVDGVTLYHLIIEGALALAGQKRILENYKQLDLFPGFQKGFTDVARDESRHVLFGVRFLHDMVQSDDRFAYRIVNFINQILPSLYESARPEPDMLAYMLQAGQDIDWRQKFYANSFRRKLRAVGIQANIPDPQPTPIPAELMAAVAAH